MLLSKKRSRRRKEVRTKKNKRKERRTKDGLRKRERASEVSDEGVKLQPDPGLGADADVERSGDPEVGSPTGGVGPAPRRPPSMWLCTAVTVVRYIR